MHTKPSVVSSVPFSSDDCMGHVHKVTTAEVVIQGTISSNIDNASIEYIAASPADLRASYTGSGLPFTSPAMAMQGTPNTGTITLDGQNGFQIVLPRMPNSYYAGHGTVIVPPTLYLHFTSRGVERTVAIVLEEPIPFRTLTYPNQRTDSTFYNVNLPVRSQEQILRDSAYPTTSTLAPDNFWGLRPPY